MYLPSSHSLCSDGNLTQYELFRFIYACSAVVAACVDTRLDVGQLKAVVMQRAQAMFRLAEINGDVVTFSDFSLWPLNPIVVIDALLQLR